MKLLVTGIGILVLTTVVATPLPVQASSRLDQARDALDQEREKIEELQDSKQELDTQVRTLEDELEYLEGEIVASEEELTATIAQITGVQNELASTREYIQQLEQQVRDQKKLMKEYVNVLYTQPDVSLVKLFLSNQNLSDTLRSVEQASAVQETIGETIISIEAKEQEIIQETQHLFDKEEELVSLRKLQEDQRNLLAQTQEEKEVLLAETKGDQDEYERLLASSFEEQSELLSTIRLLGGGGRAGALSLEEAYDLASVNAARLGNKIRPEFLVGVMKIESGLGGNVGGFYYKDALSGCAAREGNTTRLNFAREEQAFEGLVRRLGLPLTQPVSGCPFPKYIGTGGAMGPAQVMPATWLGYEPRLQQMKGGEVNPWDVEDAMLAMGMILLGKVGDQNIAGNEALERRAAMCYVGGCKHGWYADRVMNEAARTKAILGR